MFVNIEEIFGKNGFALFESLRILNEEKQSIADANKWGNGQWGFFQEFDDFFDQFRMGNSIFTDFEEVEPILFASIQSTFEFMGILKNRMEDSQLREDGNQ